MFFFGFCFFSFKLARTARFLALGVGLFSLMAILFYFPLFAVTTVFSTDYLIILAP